MTRPSRLALRLALRFALAAGAGALGIGLSREAWAHEVGLSRGDYVAKGDRVDAVIAFARREAISVLPSMDADRNESLSDAEVSASSDAYAKRVFDGVVVERDGVACAPAPAAARLVSEDGIDAYGSYACPGPTEGATITVKMPMLETLGSGHRHLVKLSNAGKLDEAMLHRREPSLTAKGGSAPAAPAPTPGGEPEAPRSVLDVARHGALRVAIGREHAGFLVVLALVAGLVPRKQMLVAAAAFLATCSAALLLAGRGVVSPSARIIDVLLAASVAYVGVENLVAKPRIARWRIALPFGIVHGFALARAFGELAVPAERAFGPLLIFGVGAAVTAAALLAAMTALATAVSKRPWFSRVGLKIASALLVALGLYGVIFALRG